MNPKNEEHKNEEHKNAGDTVLVLARCKDCGGIFRVVEPGVLVSHQRGFCNGSFVRWITCGPKVPTS